MLRAPLGQSHCSTPYALPWSPSLIIIHNELFKSVDCLVITDTACIQIHEQIKKQKGSKRYYY